MTTHHVPRTTHRVWKFGDDINTDDILPGKYAPFMVGEDRFHTFAFAHLRPEFAREVRPGDLLVFGKNAGLGSSREYAPEALKKLGIRAVVAKSYARIFFRNLVNLGIVPFISEEVVDALEDGDEVRLDLEAGRLFRGDEVFSLTPPPAFLLEALKAGSMLDYVKQHGRFPAE